jgi:hypothetical protein
MQSSGRRSARRYSYCSAWHISSLIFAEPPALLAVHAGLNCSDAPALPALTLRHRYLRREAHHVAKAAFDSAPNPLWVEAARAPSKSRSRGDRTPVWRERLAIGVGEELDQRDLGQRSDGWVAEHCRWGRGNWLTPTRKRKGTMMQPIAYVEIADGAMRPVFQDDHGQYVLADDGEPIYSDWFVPRQEWDAMFSEQPVIVDATTRER